MTIFTSRFSQVTAASLLALITLLPAVVSAQRGDDGGRPSKNGKAVQAIGDTHVTVEYGRPKVKGRTVWGGLVSYGKVWTPGANEATTITFTSDVIFHDRPVKAGSYSLWTIPGEDEWTIIANKEAGQWHTSYDSSRDLFRFQVKPESSSHFEALTFSFAEITDHSAKLVIHWEKLAVSVKISLP